MEKSRKKLVTSAALLAAFALWTVIVTFVDVQDIGPQGSRVGLARLNGFVHELTGVHMALYVLTDWLSLLPVGICLGFGLLGLGQLIGRKSIRKVDCDIVLLGGFYIAVMAAYLIFECMVVNYRPVLIDGRLEASYPSSTTMLVLCVMTTAKMQIGRRMPDGALRKSLLALTAMFTVFMMGARMISGVHWLSDIIAGALLGGALIALYDGFCELMEQGGEDHGDHRSYLL